MGRLRRSSCLTLAMTSVACVAIAGSCTGSVRPISPISDGGGPYPDAPRPLGDTGAPRDGGGLVDAPATAGDPCPSGTCGGDNICVAGLCRKMCTQPLAGCNDTAPECPADQSCMEATSFTDACFFASGTTGAACGDNGTTCLATNVCVKIDSGAPRCLKLCKYGCAGQCVETSNGCSVCLD